MKKFIYMEVWSHKAWGAARVMQGLSFDLSGMARGMCGVSRGLALIAVVGGIADAMCSESVERRPSRICASCAHRGGCKGACVQDGGHLLL